MDLVSQGYKINTIYCSIYRIPFIPIIAYIEFIWKTKTSKRCLRCVLMVLWHFKHNEIKNVHWDAIQYVFYWLLTLRLNYLLFTYKDAQQISVIGLIADHCWNSVFRIGIHIDIYVFFSVLRVVFKLNISYTGLHGLFTHIKGYEQLSLKMYFYWLLLFFFNSLFRYLILLYKKN